VWEGHRHNQSREKDRGAWMDWKESAAEYAGQCAIRAAAETKRTARFQCCTQQQQLQDEGYKLCVATGESGDALGLAL